MLEIVNIAKEYEGAVLLDGLSFHVASAEIVCLLGASGSGKSTILRIIAGLESAEGGEIHWGGEDISLVPAYRRKFGLVFQDYALFPHLTVAENIAFGLRMQDLSRQAIHIRVAELLDLVNLTGFEQRRVTDLSGGEQQRVAMARALAPRPRLLMLDEPLGALDRGLRDHLLDELRAILRAMGIPVIYVTHDQEEAFAIADRILLLRAGQIVRDANPQEVYDRPGSAWVAAFLGLGNILSGQVRADGRIQTKAGLLEVDCPHQHKSGSGVTLLLRPQHVQMAEPNAEHCIQGIVTDVAFSRDGFKVTLDSGVVVTLPKAPGMGEEVTLSYRPSDIGCLPADQGVMEPIIVIKRDLQGRETWRYQGIILQRTDKSVQLEASFNRDDIHLMGTLLKRGDRFVETFYTDRWYNVFEIHDREDDRIKGWYCNIGKPIVWEAEDRISYIDLALDLWVDPDGTLTILDEDEFAALDLDAGTRSQAWAALEALSERFARK